MPSPNQQSRRRNILNCPLFVHFVKLPRTQYSVPKSRQILTAMRVIPTSLNVCVFIATPGGCLLTWFFASQSFKAGISNLSSTDSQPLPTFGPKALESSSIESPRRRRVRRNDNVEDTSMSESTEPSNSTSLARNAAGRQKRGRKASPQITMGESCESQCFSAAECPNLQ